MSGGPACRCGEHTEPLSAPEGANRPPRLWRVWQRHSNASAFNGYRRTRSAYSSVGCLRCNAIWRTKADYVHQLRDVAEDELNIARGYPGHAEAMAARGREPA